MGKKPAREKHYLVSLLMDWALDIEIPRALREGVRMPQEFRFTVSAKNEHDASDAAMSSLAGQLKSLSDYLTVVEIRMARIAYGPQSNPALSR